MTGRDPGLTTGRPWAQSGARVGLVGGQVDGDERVERDVEARLPAASVDDRRGADHLPARGDRHLDRLARRAARREHVFDDEHAIVAREHEPAPQREHAVLPFGEERADAERARHLMADHDAAERRRQDDGRAQRLGRDGNLAAECFGVDGMLQHERALQVAAAVQAGRQPEVPIEQGAGAAVEVEQLVACHWGNLEMRAIFDSIQGSTTLNRRAPPDV